MGDPLAVLKAGLAGRYTIEQEVGRGGMAVIYLARDLRNRRPVAVKLLRPELAASVGADRFLQEIHILATLQHPHILPLYDSGEVEGSLYYIMPFIAGGASLRDRLRREGPLPLDDALQIAEEVADGLSYAHGRGVVHRDIKPENILFEEHHAVISDFGIARAITIAGKPDTDSGTAIGTTRYMSPEQFGGAVADARSDVYALGCTLYEMLAGEPPFTGPSDQVIVARVLHEAPRSLRVTRPMVPPAIERLVERALAKIPADRFPNAAEFAAALRRSQVGGGLDRRRVWLRVATVTAITTMLLAAALWWAWPRRDDAATTALPALDPNRIAVLYFDDLGGEPGMRPVVNGLTEDLIDELGRVEVLHVISPAGVKPYSQRSIPLETVARTLRVGTVVDGSVARYRDTLRLTVRLVDATTGEQLQSTTLTRLWGDLFALEQDLALEVSRILRVRLGREIEIRERRAGTNSVSAWESVRQALDLKQQAESLFRVGSRAAATLVDQADAVLQRAEALDPRWTEPLVQRGWLAEFKAGLPEPPTSAGAVRPGAVRTPADWLVVGMTYAERALRLRANDAAALELRGTLGYDAWTLHRGDSLEAVAQLAGAERDLKDAVAADPARASAWSTLSMVQYLNGEFSDAAVTLQRATDADAYLTAVARNLQLLLFAALERGDDSAAHAWCNIGQARYPTDRRFMECQLIVLGWVGHSPGAVPQAWRLLSNIERRDSAGLLAATWGVRRLMIAAILARAGQGDSARHVVSATRSGTPDSAAREGLELYEAYVQTLLGERDSAINLLRDYIRAFPRDRSYVASTRWFAVLRTDPRFQALVGLPLDSAAPSPRH